MERIGYTTPNNLDAVFAALADPKRRAMLTRLAQGDASVNDLAEPFEISQPAVSKHLKVLEDASLIVTRKQGRFKYHYLNALPLQEAIDRWIDPYRAKPKARAVLDLKSRLEGAAMPDTSQSPDFMMGE